MVFDGVTAAMRMDTCMNSLAVTNVVTGKSGHSSFITTRGYGNMFRDNQDTAKCAPEGSGLSCYWEGAGQYHGWGVQVCIELLI